MAALRQGGTGRRNGRSQGRPSGEADAVGPEALLDAAEALLHEVPPARVTREGIARQAGVNASLIRYYFGDKNGLLTALVERIASTNLKLHQEVLKKEGTAAEKLGARVRLLLQIHREYPYYQQLLYEQLWLGKTQYQQDVRSDLVGMFYGEVRKIYEEGLTNGEFREIEPRFLHVAIVGLCELFINAPYLLEELFGESRPGDDLIDQYGDFAIDMLVRGIGTGPAKPR